MLLAGIVVLVWNGLEQKFEVRPRKFAPSAPPTREASGNQRVLVKWKCRGAPPVESKVIFHDRDISPF